MTGLACFRVGALLARRAAGLSESERLEVESHRADCASCQEEARALSGLRAALEEPPSLTLQVREQVLRRAFELAGPERDSADLGERRAGYRRWARASLVAAAAAALLVVAWVGRAHWVGVAGRDHVMAGSVSTPSREIAIEGEVPADTELKSAVGARLAVGNADVELDPGSSVVWQAAQATLVLQSGGVHVTVEHVPHQRFRVSTSAFLVEVVGTRFQVNPEGVQVTRGIVRVLSADGSQVLAVLPAGGAWTARAPVKSAGSAPPAARASTPDSASEVAPVASAEVPPLASGKESEAVESVAQWLADARRALAAHRVSEAQRAVEAALHQHPSQYELAEARTLQAECAGATGDTERAVRLYLAVADQFAALPAAENALFAAARLRARKSAAAPARLLFEEYLKRYPAGRFKQEAERHLVQLESAP